MAGVMTIMEISCERTCTGNVVFSAPEPATGPCWPTPPPETPGHPRAVGHLGLCAQTAELTRSNSWSPHAPRPGLHSKEATAMRSPGTTAREWPPLLQLEKAFTQQGRPRPATVERKKDALFHVFFQNVLPSLIPCWLFSQQILLIFPDLLVFQLL